MTTRGGTVATVFGCPWAVGVPGRITIWTPGAIIVFPTIFWFVPYIGFFFVSNKEKMKQLAKIGNKDKVRIQILSSHGTHSRDQISCGIHSHHSIFPSSAFFSLSASVVNIQMCSVFFVVLHCGFIDSVSIAYGIWKFELKIDRTAEHINKSKIDIYR